MNIGSATFTGIMASAFIIMAASAGVSLAEEIMAAEPAAPSTIEAATEGISNSATEPDGAAPDEPQVAAEPQADAQQADEASPCDCGANVPTTFEDVLFDSNSYEISDETRYKLDALAVWLIDSGTRALLTGHADDLGTERYNDYLGFRRAMVIKDHLIAQGVDGAQIEAVSLGETAPPACTKDKSDECRAKSRRVTFKFTQPEPTP